MPTTHVDFIIDGFPCQGVLNQNVNSFYLDVETPIPKISYSPRKICCFGDKQIYVLYENKISSDRIFPDYIVEDYEMPNINSFEFHLDGLQDFLSVAEFHSGLVFDEILKINDEEYKCVCLNDSDKTVIKITSMYHWFELKNINDIVQRFIQLFTLVSYKRITCTEIYVVDNGKKFKFHLWKCGAFTGNRERHYSLLHAGLIYSSSSWKKILANFFEKKKSFFESCLNGFMAQIDYKCFWEYEILNICGIWDKYTKLVGAKPKCQYTAQDIEDVLNSLKRIVKQEEVIFSNPQKIVLGELLGKIELIKENLGSHLCERFRVLYNQFDENIRLLFPNAVKDFCLLKDARNEIAHGLLNHRSPEQFDELYQSFRRIRLLTIVFIYLELGIPLIDICKGIRSCFHGCVLNAKLDKFTLVSIIKDVPFFNVDEKTWKYFAQPRVYSCMRYDPRSNQLEIDEEISKKAWDEHLKSDENFYGAYVTRVCPECKNPIYQNNIFLIFNEQHKEICGSFLLNYEDVPSNMRELCEFQRTDRLIRKYL